MSLGPDGDKLRIDIDDDGPGIPIELREKVFAPFFRIDASRNRTYGGMGLGFSVARSIVRTHGGEVALSTSPLNGLRATVWLPRASVGQTSSAAVPN